jgi:hypothetical protein
VKWIFVLLYQISAGRTVLYDLSLENQIQHRTVRNGLKSTVQYGLGLDSYQMGSERLNSPTKTIEVNFPSDTRRAGGGHPLTPLAISSRLKEEKERQLPIIGTFPLSTGIVSFNPCPPDLTAGAAFSLPFNQIVLHTAVGYLIPPLSISHFCPYFCPRDIESLRALVRFHRQSIKQTELSIPMF